MTKNGVDLLDARTFFPPDAVDLKNYLSQIHFIE